MRSKLLLGAAYYLLPILMIFSIFLLLKGHYEPGGGFVGGLTAASGFALYTLTHGKKRIKQLLPTSSSLISLLGISLTLLSGTLGFIFGGNFLEAIWSKWELPVLGKLGTPFLFDLGIFLVVVGILTKVVITLAEE